MWGEGIEKGQHKTEAKSGCGISRYKPSGRIIPNYRVQVLDMRMLCQNCRPAHQGHGEAGINPSGVQKGVAKLRGSVELGDRGSQLIFFKRPERVSARVMDVLVAQGKNGHR